MTETKTYTREQIIEALQYEWELLIHDEFIEGEDMTAEESLAYFKSLTHSQLVDEILLGDQTLEEFMSINGKSND